MTITGPDEFITVKARVVWSSNQIPPEEDMPRGMGVEFINISDEHRELISSLVAADADPSDPDEDEREQGLIKEQTSIGEQNLIEKQPVEEEKKQEKKESTLEPPRKCPDGHKHISWSMGDDHIFCWDCNRTYPLVACFQSHESSLSESEEHND
jgi:formylmethanofuran dehydrogenase subunit E